MAQLNDLLVLGKSYFGGAIKANSDHDLLAHSNEFNFISPGYNGDIYINYRTASGSDGNVGNYRFYNGKGTALANIYATTFYGALSGNATSSTTATKFSSARTIALTGDVSGTASADGSSGWSISTTVADNSHNHGYLSGWADTRSAATAPNDYNGQFKVVGIKQKSLMDIDGSAYSSLIGFRGWSDSSGGNAHELAFTGNGNLYHRQGSTTTWSSWNRIPMCGTDNTFSGTNTFSGQVVLSRTTDADGTTDAKPALRIGDVSGTHLEFDGNEIMSKNSGTTVGPLYLNNSGGLVRIGSGGLQVNGTSKFLGDITLNDSTVNIVRTGISQSWYQGRNSAMIRTTSYSGYDAILSMKTTAGDWSLGVYNDNKMYFTYILDSNYNANTNTTTAQIRFDPDGNVSATKFSGSGAGLTSLNASNISTGTLAAARLPNHASTATTYGVGDATHYGHVILYPAASCTSYTSDSGGACTPAAVKKAVELFSSGGAIIYKVSG